MASEKSEDEIEREAIKVRETLCGEKKPTNAALDQLYIGFSKMDKSRVEAKVINLIERDLKKLSELPANNPVQLIKFNNIRNGYLKERERFIERKIQIADLNVLRSTTTEQIYNLMTTGDWKKNKQEISKILNAMMPLQRREVGEKLYLLVSEGQKQDVPNIHTKYSEVSGLLIEANHKALKEMENRTRSSSNFSQQENKGANRKVNNDSKDENKTDNKRSWQRPQVRK